MAVELAKELLKTPTKIGLPPKLNNI